MCDHILEWHVTSHGNKVHERPTCSQWPSWAAPCDPVRDTCQGKEHRAQECICSLEGHQGYSNSEALSVNHQGPPASYAPRPASCCTGGTGVLVCAAQQHFPQPGAPLLPAAATLLCAGPLPATETQVTAILHCTTAALHGIIHTAWCHTHMPTVQGREGSTDQQART